MPKDAAPASRLVTLRTVPALALVPELVRLSNVPVVIEDVTSDIAVCVESVPHAQLCANNVLSIEFVAVPDVIDDSAVVVPHPVQVPVIVMLFTVVVPERFVLPLTTRLLVTLSAPET